MVRPRVHRRLEREFLVDAMPRPEGYDPMADRDNHYELAFEQYLRSRGIPYVAVDEAKRSVMANGASIKSLDFIVSVPDGTAWLVDVKGRRFPSGDETRQYWKNWSVAYPTQLPSTKPLPFKCL